MNQLEYLPGIAGQSVQLDGPSAFVGIAEEMRSREWDYDLGYRDLVTATRPARTVDVTFHADYDTADELRRVADADVMARTPGTFVAQNEWKQRGYILASDVDDIHYGRLSTGLKIALLDGAWWRLVKKSFMFEEPVTTYDSATGETVSTAGAADAPLHALTVYGKSVQDGTPTPDAPVPISVVEPLTWNQLGRFVTGSSYSSNRFDGVLSNFTVSADGRSATAQNYAMDNANYYMGNKSNHVMLLDFHLSTTGTMTHAAQLNFAGNVKTYGTLATGDNHITYIGKMKGADNGSSYDDICIYPNGASYSAPTADYTISDFQIFDLTLMFGVGKEPTTVEEFEAMFPESYYPYDAGSDLFGVKVDGELTAIDLQGNVLASLPDGTKDVLTVDSVGHVVLEKRTHVWNMRDYANLGWIKSSSATNGFFLTRTSLNPIARANQYGNHYSSITTTASNAGSYFSTTNSSYIDGSFCFNLDADVVGSTVGDFKTWLSSHDVFVCAQLYTEQTIDLGYITMPTVTNDSQVSIVAAVAPIITAEWQTSPDVYLDYPHDYPYDYQKTSSTADVTPSVLTPSDVYLAVFGPAVNPYVIVGGNRYQVNVTVPAGGYLIVDGREKTINMALADGTVQNVFSSGVRGGGAGGGTYIFEKIPAGTSEVTYDGSFGFDLGWYEEEGEPPWSQS